MKSIYINPLCVNCGNEIDFFRVPAITKNLLCGKCKWERKKNDQKRNKQMIQKELLEQLRELNKRIEAERDSMSENFDEHIDAEDLTLDIQPLPECEYPKSAIGSILSLKKNSIVIFEFESILDEQERKTIEKKLALAFENNPTVKILVIDAVNKVIFTVLQPQ